jgi:glutamine cyclotransferase
MKTAKEFIKEGLDSEARSFQYQAESMMKKAMLAARAEPLLQTILEVPELPEPYVSIWSDGLHITYYNAKSFKAFEAVFTALEPLGYPVEGWKSERSDREMLYKHKGSELELTLRVSPDDSLCERVQVGTETREVPVYEIRCKEDMPAVVEKEEEQPA